MKNKIFLFLVGLLSLTSCTESALTTLTEDPSATIDCIPDEGMQRIIVSSRSELAAIIDQMGEPGTPQSRSVDALDLAYSNNQEEFVSLLEADRQRVMSSLTPEQLAEIEAEGLEYSATDSVIADAQFAMLLNAYREIQLGDTIYRYFPNGIAKADAQNASEIRKIDDLVATQIVTPENEGLTISIDNNIDFTFINYSVHKDTHDDCGNGGGPIPPTPRDYPPGTPLTLDGIRIPGVDVREVTFDDDNKKSAGDGGWLHKLWTGIFGFNVVAINKFSDSEKLTMALYDQNYLIYSKLGTSLKMQKRKFGIWWNKSATLMVHGWEMATVKYTLPAPIPPTTFTHPTPNINNSTITTWSPARFDNKPTLLFHIPILEYDFTSKDLNKIYQKAFKKVFQAASNWSKEQAKASNTGLMSSQDRHFYIIHGPCEYRDWNKGNVHSNFYAKWFPGSFSMQFSLGSSVTLKNISFSLDDKVELYQGSVYGAILYKGEWLGARIIKYHK